ncbi:MAG: glycogen/starch synthase [Bacteroidales bacterium]|nr:glycogen/starch synthase [Bacteroidales bacterium]
MKKEKQIVHIAYEVAPFYKNGGLGDVVSALPQFLSKEYNNVVISFYYKGMMNHFNNYISNDFFVEIRGVEYKFKYYYFRKNEVEYYFLNMEDEYVFCNFGFSSLNGNNPYKNLSSVIIFLYFGKAALMLIQLRIPNVTHIICHDWHAAGIFAFPSILKTIKANYNNNILSFTLIHNYGYQGCIFEDILPFLEEETLMLIKDLYNRYGFATMLGLGIDQSDSILTVSQNYAKELKEGSLPHENLKFVSQSKKKIVGLLNGVDYKIWHPSNSPYLKDNFNINSKGEKIKFKKEVFKNCGFKYKKIKDTPLILYMCRLSEQKGINLFYDAYDKNQETSIAFFKKYLDLGFTFVMYGAPAGGLNGKIHEALTLISQKFNGSFYYDPNYNEKDAHNYLASADIVLLPSLFEPCGLVQLYSMAFGAVPVVRPVGGLKDTVRCFFETNVEPTGFYIKSNSRECLYDTTKKVIEIYKNHPDIWEQIQINAMKQDFSWDKNIQDYFSLFEDMEINKTLINETA